jgi:hypothetical protein
MAILASNKAKTWINFNDRPLKHLENISKVSDIIIIQNTVLRIMRSFDSRWAH